MLTKEQSIQAEALLPRALQQASKFRDDEANGVAQLALVEAVERWQPGRLSLEDWCRLGVQNALSHWERRRWLEERGRQPLYEEGASPQACPTLVDVISSLPANLRAVATAKWLFELSDNEARAALRCSWVTYYSQLRLAREAAKTLLEEAPWLA